MGTITSLRFRVRFVVGLVVALLCLACDAVLRADTLTITGVINQSTQDGTGPAVNNPSLNNLADGDSFTVNLSFNESITSPGTFDLTGLNLLFSAPTAGAAEDNFSSASLTLTQLAGFDQVSVLGCLASGSACNQGNELDLNFLVPAATFGSKVAADGIPGLLPFELLEDDGVTDIHGSLVSFSTSAVPEPSALVFVVVCSLIVLLTQRRKKRPL